MIKAHYMVAMLLKYSTKDAFIVSCDSIVVSTLRCGCKNLGSNPGHSNFYFLFRINNCTEEGCHFVE